MSKKNRFVLLTGLCMLTYFVSYITRVNLSAAMVEMIASGFVEKTVIALALSINAITYGAGQIISGWMGDRYKPQNVMMFGFLLAAAMNLCVAFLPDQRGLVPVWAINGFAQALMWPPMVRILTQHLDKDEYAVACKWISWGGAFGTMAVYVCLPLIFRVTTYHAAFVICGSVALVMAFVWKLTYERKFSQVSVEQKPRAMSETTVHPGFTCHALFLMGLVMIAIIMQGMLRDGVSNWLPTLVSESFQLDSSAAILSGVLLPIFHILCSQITTTLYQRALRNELFCAGVVFGVGMGAAALLALLGSSSVIASVVLCAIIVGTMHSVNFLLLCIVPPFFARYGHVSLISGLLNACTYVGAAVSTYGIAVFSQANGWTATIWLWVAIAGVGTAICLGLTKVWVRFTSDKQCKIARDEWMGKA